MFTLSGDVGTSAENLMCFLAEKETCVDDYLAKGFKMSRDDQTGTTGTKGSDPECHMFPAPASLLCCARL